MTPIFPRAARIICIALLLSGCATNPVTKQSNFVLMSEAQEIKLGDETHAEIMKQYRPLDDAVLQAVVSRIGQQLAAVSHRSHLDFHFTVLDSPEVNAFALPGGHIYITRGIIAYMNSEEELAGVLGHEIGHVTARHSVRQHAAQNVAGFIGEIVAAASGNDALTQATGILGGALVSGYGRGHELEADRLGAEYLARGGYDPQKMLEVVGILKDQEVFEVQRAREEGREPQNYHGIFSTHPDNDARLQEVIAAARAHKLANPKRTEPERFLRMLEGVAFGDSEVDGIVRGNNFYHRDFNLAMAFPKSWRINNQPSQLSAVRADNRAVLVVQSEARKGNARAHLLKKYAGISGVRNLGHGRYIGAYPAETVFGARAVQVAAVPHGSQILFVVGFADGAPPQKEVRDVALSIRALNADERPLARARRIKIIRADGKSYAELARRAALGKNGADRLRLLNGVYPGGEPVAGKLIKIIQ